MTLSLFATTPKGLELLLVDELCQLGATDAAEKLAGVSFSGDLTLAYKACLWSRLANRILLALTKAPAETPEQLYAAVQSIAWDEHIDKNSNFAVQCVCSQSKMTHSLFAAQKVKDAIVDQFRNKYGIRPDVKRDQPAVQVYVYLHRDQAQIYLDLSGDSLHKRGYRLAGGAAPLKENLAAAILLRAGWPELAKNGASLFDPMCGSGTLLIEAAAMADARAPSLERDYFGFLGWKKHQPAIWQKLLADAKQQVITKPQNKIIGYDHDAAAIKIAFENIERAQLTGRIHVEKRELSSFAPLATSKSGLVVTNPPYGERLGEIAELKLLYNILGEQLKQQFNGWRAAIFTGNPTLGKQMGIRAKKYYSLWNGPIACQLLLFDVAPEYFIDRSEAAENERRIRAAQRAMQGQDQQAITMFINRLKKNLKHARKQAIQQQKTQYRVYDADLPEYAFVIDINDETAHVHEYAPPPRMREEKILQHRNEVLAVLPEILAIAPAKIFFTSAIE